MKKTILLLALLASFSSHAQRYLTDEFLVLDSIIAGVYGTAIDYQSNSQDLLFDFYEPANDTLAERPLLIYIHGGGFTSGSRTYPSVQQICRRMANKGYVVANIDYRLDPGFELYNSATDRRAMTDAMHDAKQAIRYFKANASTYKIDTSLVFIGGESAGAATAMMASFVNKQSEMSAYPMANPNDPVGSTVNADVGNNVKGTLCLCGLLLDTLAMEFPTDPSIFWSHGTDDTFVPIALAFNIVLRAAHIGLPFETRVFQGGLHCPWYFGNPDSEIYLDTTISDISNFLYPQVVNVIDNIEELYSSQEIAVYPNPFDDRVYIELNASPSQSDLKILSESGKLVLRKTYPVGQNRIELSLEKLPPGTYLILVENGEEKRVEKMVKMRH